MTRVYTANVILTTSYQKIRDVFLSKDTIKTFSDIVREGIFTEEDTFISPITKNTGLIELEYSCAGDKEGPLATFKFIDIDGFFEEKFLSKDLGKTIANKLFDSVQSVVPAISKSKVFEKFPTEEDLLGGKVNTPKQFNNEVSKSVLGFLFPKVYLAFGVSNDLAYWHGPVELSYQNANVTYLKDGVREITLSFSVAVGSPLFNTLIEDYRLDSLNGLYNKYNMMYSSYTRNSSFKVSIPLSTDDDSQFWQSIDITDTLKDFLKVYAKTLTGYNNVIVVLPKLSELNTRISTEAEKIKSGYGLDSLSERNRIRSENKAVIQVITNIMKEFSLKVFSKPAKEISYGIEAAFELVPSRPNEFKEAVFNKTNLPSFDLINDYSLDGEALVVDSEYSVLPDPFEILKNLSIGLTETISNQGPLQLVIENNVKICNLIKIQVEKTLGEKFDDGPIVIIGLENLIRNLVYLEGVTDLDKAITKDIFKGNIEDLGVVFNNNYRREFYESFIKPITKGSLFGENPLIKDDLVLDDVDNLLGSDLLVGYPIFTYGTKNSNVLDLSIDFNKQYTSAFIRIVKENVVGPYLNTATNNFLENLDNEIKKYDANNVKIITDIIKDKIGNNFNISEDDLNKIKLSVKEKYESSVDYDPRILPFGFRAIEFLTTSGISRNNQSNLTLINNLEELEELTTKILIQYLYSNNAINGNIVNVTKVDDYYTLLYKYLNGLGLTAKIRTLPFFNIQQPLGRSAVLIGVDNVIDRTRNRIKLAPFSSVYNIVKFKHVLSVDDVYSEFDMIKAATTRELF